MSESMSTAATHVFEDIVVDAPAEAGPSSMGDAAAALSLESAFDIEATAKLILDNGYKTIGLQFPDDLLPSSPAVYRALQERVGASGAQAFVLADSTYGACCPDVLSCLHLPADLLVHYGHACLTPTDALPVHYVFPRRSLDSAAALAALTEASGDELKEKKGIVLVWDVAYDWLADEIVSTFSEAPLPVSTSRITRPSLKPKDAAAAAETSLAPAEASSCGTQEGSGCCSGSTDVAAGPCDENEDGTCGANGDFYQPAPAPLTRAGSAPALRTIAPPSGVDLADCAIWYLGSEGRSLLNLQMTHATHTVVAYAPEDGAHAVMGSSRLLSRRLYALHQAMSADVFGLVIGNVGLASSRPLAAELRAALARAQKKSYTLSVGRLNPAKLANFAEIECFVLIGCAEGGVVDSKDFLRPIITPYELTLALQGSEHVWDPSKWTLDLGSVLDAATQSAAAPAADPNASDDELEFSLVTGTYRTRKTFTDDPAAAVAGGADGIKDLTLRDSNYTLAKLESAGSMYLQSRHFQGLDPRYGQDEPAVLEQGRSGIARGYTEEKTE